MAQQSGVITLTCWPYSSWCSPALLLLLQGCASDTHWALLRRFGILSITSWVLASSKQQTSQDSELGQQLQCSRLPLASFDLLSRTSRSSWIPVELVRPCHLLPRLHICFSVDFFYFFFIFPDDGRAAVFIATGHESSGNLIPQVALLPVCVWVLLLIILFHLHCEASVLAHVVLLPASCCFFPAHLPWRSRTCWPLPAAPWADSSGVQPKPASHHSHLILHSPTQGCILVAHHLCKHLSPWVLQLPWCPWNDRAVPRAGVGGCILCQVSTVSLPAFLLELKRQKAQQPVISWALWVWAATVTASPVMADTFCCTLARWGPSRSAK